MRPTLVDDAFAPVIDAVVIDDKSFALLHVGVRARVRTEGYPAAP